MKEEKFLKKIFKALTILTIASVSLVGCGSDKEIETAKEAPSASVGQAEKDKEESGKKKDEVTKKEEQENKEELKNKEKENKNEEKEDKGGKESIDLSVKPNEMGKVMVLMYHNIGEEEATWVRTPENFRRDLNTLYEKGYRAISLEDFAQNNIDVEEGKTPVVFTFDDGNQNNFNIIEKDGKKVIDPNSAVGIMEEFNKEYPDFNMTATFFINGLKPFRQDDLIEYKLNWLVDNGYDVGNHTLGHNNMSNVKDPLKIQKYIGKQAQFLESFVEGYKVNTYALSYGGRPEDKHTDLLAKGEYEGFKYENVAILNVGWDPSVSPNHKNFNPLAIHRVRASETNVDNVGMYDWMEMFENHPNRRYISDGNPDIVTVPKKYEENIDKEGIKDKKLYLYEEQ